MNLEGYVKTSEERNTFVATPEAVLEATGWEEPENWGYKPQNFFFEENGVYEVSTPGVRYYGVELEVETPFPEGVAEALRDVPTVYTKWDDSVRGLEIITHPCTLPVVKDVLYDVLDIIEETGIEVSGFNGDNTGLHVHVSRVSPLDTKRGRGALIKVVRDLWRPLVAISGRPMEEIGRWADKPWDAEGDFSSTRAYYEALVEENTDRYRAVNLRPSMTVEFRLMKATVWPTGAVGSVELVDGLVAAAYLELTEGPVRWNLHRLEAVLEALGHERALNLIDKRIRRW